MTGVAQSGWAADTSNVEWCEAVTHLYALHPCCAELANTATNLFAFSAGCVGLWRAARLGLPVSFVFTEVIILVVAIGSAIFHATRSYYAEMLDELPMSIMAIGYVWVLKDKHWLTQPPYWEKFVASYITAVACAWIGYVKYHWYGVFVICFTLQVIVAALISLDAGPLRLRYLWWYFWLPSILAGKALWEVERHLHRSNQCPTSMMNVTWWLHAMWHFFSALSHSIWMYYAANIPATTRRALSSSLMSPAKKGTRSSSRLLPQKRAKSPARATGSARNRSGASQ
mmetsp:Transcript_54251/g.79534  ORF Transcript_54251/g.79534 Transcript_54251/m.79534 type:complete len:285 (+) Transcript_54251:49-903(+)